MLESGWYISKTWWLLCHQHTAHSSLSQALWLSEWMADRLIHFDLVCFVFFFNSCPLKAHTCTCLFFCEHLCGRIKSIPSPLCWLQFMF